VAVDLADGRSLTVKVAFVILTLLGHASLWGAIAADTGHLDAQRGHEVLLVADKHVHGADDPGKYLLRGD